MPTTFNTLDLPTAMATIADLTTTYNKLMDQFYRARTDKGRQVQAEKLQRINEQRKTLIEQYNLQEWAATL